MQMDFDGWLIFIDIGQTRCFESYLIMGLNGFDTRLKRP